MLYSSGNELMPRRWPEASWRDDVSEFNRILQKSVVTLLQVPEPPSMTVTACLRASYSSSETVFGYRSVPMPPRLPSN